MIQFLILGGYGNTGSLIAELLIKYTDSCVIISGRNNVRAKQTSDKLNNRYNTDRVSYIRCDASDKTNLTKVFNKCNFVIAASSTSQYVKNTTEAAIEAGIDYFDVQVSAAKISYLQSVKDEIKQSNRVFITDGGFHPGLPALMVRYSSQFFDNIYKANVGSLILLNWAQYNFSDSTVSEFVKEFKDYSTMAYKNKRWEKIKIYDKQMMKDFVFEQPFGNTRAYLMFLEEMKELTSLYPSLEEAGFYIQGFNKITNTIIIPFISLWLKLFPGYSYLAGKLFDWSMRKFSKPPFKCILQLEAEGISNSQNKKYQLVISHEDGYLLTAIPVVATLLQYIDGLKKEGLHFMAHYPEPVRFMNDIKRMGLNINCSEQIFTQI